MSAMSDRRYLNPAQPQTLQIAVFILYLDGGLAVLGLLSRTQSILVALVSLVVHSVPLAVVLAVAGYVGGGYGIANEKKWGYAVGLVMALLPFGLGFFYLGNQIFGAFGLLGLLFAGALVALLVHPQSRDYQRIWFK